ncbi:hypothetical protein JKP88DRAFT_347680 [Tribonema minus]|uniref:FH2 domain-containing protein n=1 Tax=Tribonema minus TaxID=303371 RepID=A0A835ZAW9_9STRA|nr:hypothetical protein JKP88DRAFT_347680 [Tribonema minus]
MGFKKLLGGVSGHRRGSASQQSDSHSELISPARGDAAAPLKRAAGGNLFAGLSGAVTEELDNVLEALQNEAPVPSLERVLDLKDVLQDAESLHVPQIVGGGVLEMMAAALAAIADAREAADAAVNEAAATDAAEADAQDVAADRAASVFARALRGGAEGAGEGAAAAIEAELVRCLLLLLRFDDAPVVSVLARRDELLAAAAATAVGSPSAYVRGSLTRLLAVIAAAVDISPDARGGNRSPAGGNGGNRSPAGGGGGFGGRRGSLADSTGSVPSAGGIARRGSLVGDGSGGGGGGGAIGGGRRPSLMPSGGGGGGRRGSLGGASDASSAYGGDSAHGSTHSSAQMGGDSAHGSVGTLRGSLAHGTTLRRGSAVTSGGGGFGVVPVSATASDDDEGDEGGSDEVLSGADAVVKALDRAAAARGEKLTFAGLVSALGNSNNGLRTKVDILVLFNTLLSVEELEVRLALRGEMCLANMLGTLKVLKEQYSVRGVRQASEADMTDGESIDSMPASLYDAYRTNMYLSDDDITVYNDPEMETDRALLEDLKTAIDQFEEWMKQDELVVLASLQNPATLAAHEAYSNLQEYPDSQAHFLDHLEHLKQISSLTGSETHLWAALCRAAKAMFDDAPPAAPGQLQQSLLLPAGLALPVPAPRPLPPPPAPAAPAPSAGDPRVDKYLKMLKAGVPRGAVEMKMSAEGLDPSLLDGPGNDDDAPPSYASVVPAAAAATAAAAAAAASDPRVNKYLKMLKAGVPRGAVEQKMAAEGLDPSLLDGGAAAAAPAPASDPRVDKYLKMLKAGVPRGAVEQKMAAEGLDSSLLDGGAAAAAPAPASDPRVDKYLKMLKAGVPRGAVEQKMATEGLDSSLLDGPGASGAPPPLPGGMLRGMPPPLPGMARGPPPLPGMMPKAALPPPPKIKKPDFTRRAFHVERLEGPAVNSSIFTKVDAKLTIPKDLLREAFEQKPLTPAQMAVQKKKENDENKKAEESNVKRKRSILMGKTQTAAGMKIQQLKLQNMTGSDVLRAVAVLDENFLRHHMKSLTDDFWPKGKADEQSKKSLEYKDLETALSGFKGPLEEIDDASQLILALWKMKDRHTRLECTDTIINFAVDAEVLTERIQLMSTVFREVTGSKKLQQIMVMTLELANFLNEGTVRENAQGVPLSALLKLETVKYFDKKGTLLHMLAIWAKKDHPEVLALEKDLPVTCDDAVKKEDIEDLNKQVQLLGKKVKQVKDFTAAMSETDQPDIGGFKDKFVPCANKFLLDANSKLDALRKYLKEASESYHTTAKLYGENPEQQPANAFVGMVSRFAAMLKRAQLENHQREVTLERQRRAAKDKADKEAMVKARQAARKAAASPAGGGAKNFADAATAAAAAQSAAASILNARFDRIKADQAEHSNAPALTPDGRRVFASGGGAGGPSRARSGTRFARGAGGGVDEGAHQQALADALQKRFRSGTLAGAAALDKAGTLAGAAALDASELHDSTHRKPKPLSQDHLDASDNFKTFKPRRGIS